ncbi:MAG: hypothetical protein DMG92_12735, partial [Acidobacteria bacterium]
SNKYISNNQLNNEQLKHENLNHENLNHENLNHQEILDSANHPDKITVSDRKREANRQNAKKSTGPRTAEGKNHSSRNGITHGLYAKNANFELSQEDKEEFTELCERCRLEIGPIGILEELEVERMAMFHWKLKRLFRFENAVNGLAAHSLRTRLLSELSSNSSNCAQTSDADATTSFPIDAKTRRVLENLREIELGHIAQAKIDLEGVPHPMYLDIIHRVQSATQKGLNDSLKRLKSLRKFRLSIKLTDDQLCFPLREYNDDGSITV